MKLVNYFTANARQWDKFKLEFRLLGFTFIELRNIIREEVNKAL